MNQMTEMLIECQLVIRDVLILKRTVTGDCCTSQLESQVRLLEMTLAEVFKK